MAGYWQVRYLEALSKSKQACSPQTRSAYVDLAAHYAAMRHFCERNPLRRDVRTAA